MMRAVLGTVVLLAASMAHADWQEVFTSCKSLPDPEFSTCVRKKASEQEEVDRKALEKKRKEEEEASSGWRFALRNKSTAITDFSGAQLGDEGASLSATRKNGVDNTSAQVGIFAYSNAFWSSGLGITYQPFLGAGWQRDPTADPKVDLRDFTAGVVGSIGDLEDPFRTIVILQGIHREDVYDQKDGQLARAHFDFVVNDLTTKRASLVPQLGGLLDHRTSGTTEGNWGSIYAGFVASLTVPLIKQQSITGTLTVRKLHDLHVPSGGSERRDKYLAFSLNYNLFDVDNKSASLQPAIFLERQVGTDFLSGIEEANKTSFGIRVKWTD